MELTERQERILNIIVEEYIKSARPISSKFLEKEHDFDICPASIRVEMQKLTNAGLIFQPHTSAGRIPTDKGYRFFVDSLFNKESGIEDSFGLDVDNLFFKEEVAGSIKLLQDLTREVALISSSLTLGYLFEHQVSWKEGWARIIKEPEFSEKEIIDNLIETIEFFEKEIVGFEDDFDSSLPINVYIGDENQFAKAKEFSIIVTRCFFPEKEKAKLKGSGVLAIFGPKRMDYNKNINLLNCLIKNLDEQRK